MISGGDPSHERLYEQVDYPTKRVTSPTWGPPPPCKQAVRAINTQGGKLLVTIELNSIDNFNKRMIPYRSKMPVENMPDF